MRKHTRFLALLAVMLSLIFSLSNITAEEKKLTPEEEEALKRHAYSLNKPNLKSAKWLERAGACERIGVIGMKEYADDIAPLLKDQYFLVRVSAVRGIGLCKNPKYIPNIAEMLISLGVTEEDRMMAVSCGQSLGQIDADASVDAVMALNKEKNTGNYGIALALGYIGGAKASDAVTTFITAKDPLVQGAAYRSAGKLTTPLDHKAIAKVLADPKANEMLKLDMLSAIRNRKDATAKQYLTKALDSKNSLVGGAAAWAIAEIGLTKQEATAIISSAEKGSRSMKLAALKCMLMGGAKDGAEVVAPFLKSSDEFIRLGAMMVLAQYPCSALKQEILKAFNGDRTKYIKNLAAVALGNIKDEEVSKDLAQQVKSSKDKDFIARACEALSIARHSSVLPTLTEAIKSAGEADKDIVMMIGMAMADISQNEAADYLISLLNDSDAGVRSRAVKALRYIPTQKVVEILIGQFDRDSSKMKPSQMEAYKMELLGSLERISGHRYRPDSESWKAWWELYQKRARGKSIIEANKKAAKNEQRKDKTENLKNFGGSGDSEESVELGLYWLLRHQDLDGSWTTMQYSKHCKGTSCSPPGLSEYDIAMSALTLLCMSSAGYTHKDGKYADVCERALEFVLSNLTASGCVRERSTDEIVSQGSAVPIGGLIYEQSICATMVADVFSITDDERLKVPCQAMTDWLMIRQNILNGWRYVDMPESKDSSVTGWIVLAGKTARVHGFRVFEKAFEGALNWLDSVSDKYSEYETLDLGSEYFDSFKQNIYEKKGTGYDDTQVLPAMTAISLITRRFMGFKRTHPYLRAQANYLNDWNVAFDKSTGARNFNTSYYFVYYATLANFQMGAEYWKRWNEQLIPNIRKIQVLDQTKCSYGSWEPGSAYENMHAGRIMAAIFMILSLEVYYRYQPMIEENDIIIQ